MSDPRICESCQAWVCKAEDAWCGYCKSPCSRIELIVKPSILIVGEVAPRLGILLRNPTLSPLTISSIVAPEWLTVEPCVGRTVEPGGECRFLCRAATDTLTQPQGGEITIRTSIGDATHSVSAIDEDPAIVCTPDEIEVWESPSRARQKVSIEMAPRAGELTIHAVESGGSTGLNVATALKKPFRSSATCRLPLDLHAESGLLVKKPYATLLVRFEGAHGKSEKEVRIGAAVRSAPQLSWADPNKPAETRFQTAGQHLRFALRNQADDDLEGGRKNAKLTIQSVTLTPPQECVGAVIQPLTRLPIEIFGGQEGAIEFDLNLEHMQRAPTNLFHFVLDVTANVPVARRRVPFIIEPLRPFEGMLAIDFGSSNTTCAALETDCDLELIPLEGDKPISPTYVQYLSLASTEPEVRIGSDPKMLASVDEAVAAGTLSALKQKLGETNAELIVRPQNSELWFKRSAATVAADYLHEIRRTAETKKNAVFHEFLVTHPSICSYDQFRNLNHAIKQAFGDGTIHWLQEPVAAVVPLIKDITSRSDAPRHDFTVASFDLGGGTTDIAVLVVHRGQSQYGFTEIRPQIINSRGKRFGGEDLTTFLETRLLENCNRFLETMHPGERVVRERMSGVLPDTALRNKSELRRTAESFKASLSREKNTAPHQINLAIYVEQTQSVQERIFSFSDIRAAGGRDIEREFADHTRGKLHELVEILRKCAAKVQTLDYIHLSGKTSFLPIVEETIHQAFPRAKIIPAKNPKECVVAGACLSVSMRKSTKRRLVLPFGAQRTTSSIGVFDVVTRVFSTILPVDRDIPADGLKGELKGYWFGEEKISLWENLALEDEDVEVALHDELLAKLGTWKPERTVPLGDGQPWTLLLVLKDFQLQVSAVGSQGGEVFFHRVGGNIRP